MGKRKMRVRLPAEVERALADERRRYNPTPGALKRIELGLESAMQRDGGKPKRRKRQP